MKRTNSRVAAGVALLAYLSVGPAYAQEASDLPGGATTLKESYRDWTVSCAARTIGGAVTTICALAQEQVESQSKRRVLAVEMRRKDGEVEATFVLPFGLDLGKGVVLQIDDEPALPLLPFRTCKAIGCLADIKLDSKITARLRGGKSLKVNVSADGGGEKRFPVSLDGFPEALNRMMSLTGK